MDLSRNIATLGRLGVDVPLKVNEMGQCVLSAASFGYREWTVVGIGSTRSVPWFARHVKFKRPNLPNGGFRFPFSKDGLYQVHSPSTLTLRKVVCVG